MLLAAHIRKKVYRASARPCEHDLAKLKRFGKVHAPVFTPAGTALAGFLVQRPDAAGMIKRDDVFVAFDRMTCIDTGWVIDSDEAAFDGEACKRLQLDWDCCVLWLDMEVHTHTGEPLGRVRDVEVDTQGKVIRFLVNTSSVARNLIGDFVVVPAQMKLVDGVMQVDPAVLVEGLSGGLAGVAGQRVHDLKEQVATVSQKASEHTEKALIQGGFALGKMIASTKQSFQEASGFKSHETDTSATQVASTASPQRSAESTSEVPSKSVVTVPAPSSSLTSSLSAPSAPAAKSTQNSQETASTTQQKKVTSSSTRASQPSQKAAHEVGKQLGRMGSMFSAFAKEFKDAQK